MQGRLTKKLSAALKANSNDQRQGHSGGASSSVNSNSRKKAEQYRHHQLESVEDEEDEEQDFEDEDQDIRLSPDPQRRSRDQQAGRKGERSSRERSSGHQRETDQGKANFYNNRLGAFLPGNCHVPDTSRSRSQTPKGRKQGSKGVFGGGVGQTGSKGFITEELEDDDDDLDTDSVIDINTSKKRTEPEEEDDDYEDVEDEEEIEDDRKRNHRRSSEVPPQRKSSKTKTDKKQYNHNNVSKFSKGRSGSSGIGSSKKPSKINLGSSSKDRLGRKSSLKKVSIDVDILQPASRADSVNSFIAPLKYSNSSTRLGGNNSSYSLGRRGSSVSSASSSREVMALPIEIPDSVTDEDAFRRYLSVRRGANTDIRPHLAFEENQSSYESVGVGGPNRFPASMALNGKYSTHQGSFMGAETSRRTMSLSYAIMTLALLSASASQLRFLVAYSKAHSYPVLNYFLICLCIIIEIVVGVGYLILSRFNFTDAHVEKIQSYLIAGLFIVAVANVIIAAFAFDDHVCEVLAKQTEMFDTIDQSSK